MTNKEGFNHLAEHTCSAHFFGIIGDEESHSVGFYLHTYVIFNYRTNMKKMKMKTKKIESLYPNLGG